MATIEQTGTEVAETHRAPTRAALPRRRPAHDAHEHGDHGGHAAPGSPTPSWRCGCSSSSDCLFFGAFISTYLLYRGRAGQEGPDAEGALRHPVHVGDVVHPADEQSRRWCSRSPRSSGATTAASGSGSSPPRCSAPRSSPARSSSSPSSTARACNLDTSLFGSTLLRAHRLPRRARHRRHPLAALAVGPVDAGPAADRTKAERVEIAGLYWHFVDVVWIVIFTVIYLIPQPGTRSTERRRRDERATAVSEPEGTIKTLEHELSAVTHAEMGGVLQPAPDCCPGEVTKHPTPFKYVMIFVILVVVTGVEIGDLVHRGRDPERPHRRAAARSSAFVKFVLVACVVHAPAHRPADLPAVLHPRDHRRRWSCTSPSLLRRSTCSED